MGFEVFRIELRGGRAKYRDAVEAVRRVPHAHPDHGSIATEGSTYFLVEDGEHVLEIEVMDVPVKVSCRFTLCHPASVDVVLFGVVRELMAGLGMDATICDDVHAAHARSYALAEFRDFAAIAKNYIAARRTEWIAAYGNETLAATTNEVYERMILPRCEPAVKQPT